jgi:hypothetical protein
MVVNLVTILTLLTRNQFKTETRHAADHQALSVKYGLRLLSLVEGD